MLIVERKFEGTPFDPTRVSAVLEALTSEVAGVEPDTDMLGSVILPSGMRQTLHHSAFRELVRHLAAGVEPYLEVTWRSEGQRVLKFGCMWLSRLECNFSAEDEATIEKAVGVFARAYGASPLGARGDQSSQHLGSPLAEAIRALDESLWCRYVQAGRDIADPGRLSYHAPMHDLRDVLSQVLRDLAPDAAVTGQEWYHPEPNTNGPTQTQRARYILESVRGRRSGAVGVADSAISALSKLARATYSRASAAHREATRVEASQVLRYVDALLSDLLGVQGR
jgi:hypothetical protein